MAIKDLPKLQAVFFRSGSGREPVRDWLMTLTKDEHRQIGTVIAYVPAMKLIWRITAGRSGSVAKANKHRGSNFDDFLRDQKLYENVQAAALKRAIAEALADSMHKSRLSKVEMAKRMRTSRSQLDRLLDPDYTSVQLDTLIKAASALGQELCFSLKKSVVE